MTKTVRERLYEYVNKEDLFFVDGFDDAIIGLDTNSLRVVYSKQKMISICLEIMDWEDSMSHLCHNIWGGYIGEQTPIFMDELDCFE
jgi:hypothetical protein